MTERDILKESLCMEARSPTGRATPATERKRTINSLKKAGFFLLTEKLKFGELFP